MNLLSSTGANNTGPPAAQAVAAWLLVCCAMIFVMVVLGGITRLTHAGLSMVEWKPLMGLLPPLMESEWQDVFARYQAFPEYQKLNQGMTLEEFKGIFWVEYLHRLWGRAIGAVFLAGFLFFLLTGRIEKWLRPHLVVIFVLGGLQGFMGWYMVKSGFVDRPDVSHYRLALHLVAAFVIYAYILWIALALLLPRTGIAASPAASHLKNLSRLVLALVFLTVFSGGFVAGLDAGLGYNTFPLMGGHLVPEDLLLLDPWYINLFENVATVQFDHRLLATVTLAAILILWLRAWKTGLSGRTAKTLHALLAIAGLQVALGIATLLFYVPVGLAAFHQTGALVLFTLALWTAFELRGFGKET